VPSQVVSVIGTNEQKNTQKVPD